MAKLFFLIYFVVTADQSLGFVIEDRYFTTLEKCENYMNTIALPDFKVKEKTSNIYNFDHDILVKENDSNMVVYMSCKERPNIPCGGMFECQ